MPPAHRAPVPFQDEAVDAGAPLLTSLASSLRRARVRFGFMDALAAYRENAADAFAGDAAAGIVVAVMLVPQAMAYAQLSGMPPVTGFFAAILSLFLCARRKARPRRVAPTRAHARSLAPSLPAQ